MFLIAGTMTRHSMAMKGICITMAYLSLILLDGWICAGNAMSSASPGYVAIDKNSSPFGLVFIVISLWSFALVGFLGDGKSKEKDNEL